MTRALLRTRPLLLFLLTLAAVLESREATTVYGFRVRFRKALLRADDPRRLEAALRPPAEER